MTKAPKLAKNMGASSESSLSDLGALLANSQEPVAAKASSKGKRYAGMKTMLIPVPPEHHRKLRMIAIQRDGWTLERTVQEAIAEYIQRNNEK